MTGEAAGTVARIAATLGRRARRRKPKNGAIRPLPALWFMTDPVRTPDPLAVAARLPRGAAVIYRTFGAADAAVVAKGLRRITRARGQRLLIAADWRLAAKIDADGVHLPERMMHKAAGLRRRRTGWLITAAAHDARAVVAGARAGVDALIVSAVFASRSPSAGPALGPVRFAALVGRSRTPVMALGGINSVTAARLKQTGAAGLAGVDVFAGPRT